MAILRVLWQDYSVVVGFAEGTTEITNAVVVVVLCLISLRTHLRS
jgi:hypothetical protein